MALTKLEVLDLFLTVCTKETVAQRMIQMYQALGSAQQDAAFEIIRSDVLTKLNEIKSRYQESDLAIEDMLTSTDSQISDVTGA